MRNYYHVNSCVKNYEYNFDYLKHENLITLLEFYQLLHHSTTQSTLTYLKSTMETLQ